MKINSNQFKGQTKVKPFFHFYFFNVAILLCNDISHGGHKYSYGGNFVSEYVFMAKLLLIFI